jgi:hypothetical protein
MPTRSIIPRTTTGRVLGGLLLVTFTGSLLITSPSWFVTTPTHALFGGVMIGVSGYLVAGTYGRTRARVRRGRARMRDASAAVNRYRYGQWRDTYRRRGQAQPVRGRDGRFKGSRRR